ncbi:hypothetical protein CEUSTIGMA_g13237.t1 [Chlamydomonas eustigma]|uniref:Uncharacterized protein n=1 Tax=Chlamydomonas eustigma TaxID=1157962 RepID=A0A250XSB9_9CHLO|nr:hypothetical protein CEUSTIGMA_g13237.t1 [Chlamydomonas eustigma]|eukprot:GAX85822.1 hypothetical protein CEUSTIGMA_g13237.t1 [Chlamydomonas eustigma]
MSSLKLFGDADIPYYKDGGRGLTDVKSRSALFTDIAATIGSNIKNKTLKCYGIVYTFPQCAVLSKSGPVTTLDTFLAETQLIVLDAYQWTPHTFKFRCMKEKADGSVCGSELHSEKGWADATSSKGLGAHSTIFLCSRKQGQQQPDQCSQQPRGAQAMSSTTKTGCSWCGPVDWSGEFIAKQVDDGVDLWIGMVNGEKRAMLHSRLATKRAKKAEVESL